MLLRLSAAPEVYALETVGASLTATSFSVQVLAARKKADDIAVRAQCVFLGALLLLSS